MTHPTSLSLSHAVPFSTAPWAPGGRHFLQTRRAARSVLFRSVPFAGDAIVPQKGKKSRRLNEGAFRIPRGFIGVTSMSGVRRLSRLVPRWEWHRTAKKKKTCIGFGVRFFRYVCRNNRKDWFNDPSRAYSAFRYLRRRMTANEKHVYAYTRDSRFFRATRAKNLSDGRQQ